MEACWRPCGTETPSACSFSTKAAGRPMPEAVMSPSAVVASCLSAKSVLASCSCSSTLERLVLGQPTVNTSWNASEATEALANPEMLSLVCKKRPLLGTSRSLNKRGDAGTLATTFSAGTPRTPANALVNGHSCSSTHACSPKTSDDGCTCRTTVAMKWCRTTVVVVLVANVSVRVVLPVVVSALAIVAVVVVVPVVVWVLAVVEVVVVEPGMLWASALELVVVVVPSSAVVLKVVVVALLAVVVVLVLVAASVLSDVL
mmetsp:Transcript_143968/g.401200  ORF Transcript_143968/g.401200 Transcript_143968/m.401200 type:complete len:259 (+) Transcript_143968:1049-1825(+)